MPENRDKLVFLLGIDRIRLRHAARAGDTLVIEATLQKLRATMGRMAGTVRVGGRTIATGVVTFALCGFANIASVGINVAGYNVLAPHRRAEVIGLVWKAMAVGFLATCLAAAVVGAMPAALFG